MITSYQNTRLVNINGTISNIPLTKIWWLFALTVILIILVIISADFDDLYSLIMRTVFVLPMPVVIWQVLIQVYAGNHITRIAQYRYYFVKKYNEYQVDHNLFLKG